MSSYDPQRRANRPKPSGDEPVPVDDLLAPPHASAPVTPSAPSATTAPAPRYENPPTGGGKGKAVTIGVAVTAVLFALRWALKRRHKDD